MASSVSLLLSVFFSLAASVPVPQTNPVDLTFTPAAPVNAFTFTMPGSGNSYPAATTIAPAPIMAADPAASGPSGAPQADSGSFTAYYNPGSTVQPIPVDPAQAPVVQNMDNAVLSTGTTSMQSLGTSTIQPVPIVFYDQPQGAADPSATSQVPDQGTTFMASSQAPLVDPITGQADQGTTMIQMDTTPVPILLDNASVLPIAVVNVSIPSSSQAPLNDPVATTFSTVTTDSADYSNGYDSTAVVNAVQRDAPVTGAPLVLDDIVSGTTILAPIEPAVTTVVVPAATILPVVAVTAQNDSEVVPLVMVNPVQAQPLIAAGPVVSGSTVAQVHDPSPSSISIPNASPILADPTVTISPAQPAEPIGIAGTTQGTLLVPAAPSSSDPSPILADPAPQAAQAQLTVLNVQQNGPNTAYQFINMTESLAQNVLLNISLPASTDNLLQRLNSTASAMDSTGKLDVALQLTALAHSLMTAVDDDLSNQDEISRSSSAPNM